MNKVMIITGGSRGIGAATVRLAAASGYAVCISYLRNKQAADAVVQGIAEAGIKATAVAADVSVKADVVRLFERVDVALGAVSALVNNAGILERHMRVEEMDAGRQPVFLPRTSSAASCARERRCGGCRPDMAARVARS